MNAGLPRRAALCYAGLALLAESLVPVRAAATGDTQLLALFAKWCQAEAAIERACDAADVVAPAHAEAAKRAVFAALDASDAIVGKMAETSAQGVTGLKVKAQVAAEAYATALTEDDKRLIESFHADATRLVDMLTGRNTRLIRPTSVPPLSFVCPPVIPPQSRLQGPP